VGCRSILAGMQEAVGPVCSNHQDAAVSCCASQQSNVLVETVGCDNRIVHTMNAFRRTKQCHQAQLYNTPEVPSCQVVRRVQLLIVIYHNVCNIVDMPSGRGVAASLLCHTTLAPLAPWMSSCSTDMPRPCSTADCQSRA
jgi:hypothetical protein